MEYKDLVRKAMKDFNEISNFISQYNGNLVDCCSVLGGHNLTDNQFDLNYKNICVTIMRDDFTNKLYVDKDSTENTIEIYDDEDYRFLVDVNGHALITFWYLPTRVKDIVYITGAEMEMC